MHININSNSDQCRECLLMSTIRGRLSKDVTTLIGKLNSCPKLKSTKPHCLSTVNTTLDSTPSRLLCLWIISLRKVTLTWPQHPRVILKFMESRICRGSIPFSSNHSRSWATWWLISSPRQSREDRRLRCEGGALKNKFIRCHPGSQTWKGLR